MGEPETKAPEKEESKEESKEPEPEPELESAPAPVLEENEKEQIKEASAAKDLPTPETKEISKEEAVPAPAEKSVTKEVEPAKEKTPKVKKKRTKITVEIEEAKVDLDSPTLTKEVSEAFKADQKLFEQFHFFC